MKSSNKVHSFGKRDQAIRRNPNVPVVVRGWLHKQVRRLRREGGRELVLSDFHPSPDPQELGTGL